MNQRFRLQAAVLILPVLMLAAAGAAVADIVEKEDGREVAGDLLSVDDSWVVIRSAGNNIRIPRAAVRVIRFDRNEARSVWKVEIRNVRSSDAIDVLLEDQVVIRDARVGGSWVDLTPRLKAGNNRLRFRIRNEDAGWGYHLQLRINGEVETIGCGKPPSFSDPCRCCGKEGYERGVIDDLPALWIYVDVEEGYAELVQ